MLRFARLAALLAAVSLAFAQDAPQPPKFRLGNTARPLRYAIDLTLVPAETTFSGKASIDLELREPAPVVWMHGADLTVQEATLRAGAKTLKARPIPSGEFLGFAFDEPAPAGKATLQVVYQGKIQEKSSAGLFHNQDGGNWYLFSQFESTDARRAFPCFDEPGFKVPWQLTLHVKKEHVALTNQPQVSEAAEPGGMKAVKFAETRPLPSYLVAIAVGPFEVVDAGKHGKKRTPLRIITLKGQSGWAKWAVESTGPLFTLLEDYFGMPYAYDKLDSIAVPLFFGAMENPGLITYAQTMIVSKPEDDSISRRRGYAEVAAHEMAHLWFGDLVTTAWWDDVWLNEGFATWMAARIMQQWKPEWSYEVSNAGSRLGAMNSDSLVSARKIRQPVNDRNDVANAFDGITYGKSSAVIYMFEHWIGPEKFRKGVQRYMKKHADGNATAADFLAAISAEAGRDVAPAFSTFLDQAGVPLISAELACRQNAPPAVALSQKRFMPLGSRLPQTQNWQIPVCFRYGDGAASGSQCALMTDPRTEVELRARACPAWLVLNDGISGYYRTHYRGDLLGRLLKPGVKLSNAERLGIIRDVSALVQTGDAPIGEALKLAADFAHDPNRQITTSAVSIAAGIQSQLVPDELRPNYARFIAKTFGERARELGWLPKPGDDDDTRLLRPTLVSLVADRGEDQALIEQARELARKWLDDRKAVPPDMVSAVLSVAAHHGDRSLYDRFVAEAKKNQDEKERGRLIGALSAFRDPAIVKNNFDLFLAGEFDARISLGLLFSGAGDPETREMPYRFVTGNYDRVVARLPNAVGADYSAFLPMVATVFCDEQHRSDAEAFFKERSAKASGGPRMLAQALERISQCSAMRTAQQPSVVEFLKQY